MLETRTIGWSTLLTARIDEVQLGQAETELLGHVHGRYLPIPF